MPNFAYENAATSLFQVAIHLSNSFFIQDWESLDFLVPQKVTEKTDFFRSFFMLPKRSYYWVGMRRPIWAWIHWRLDIKVEKFNHQTSQLAVTTNTFLNCSQRRIWKNIWRIDDEQTDLIPPSCRQRLFSHSFYFFLFLKDRQNNF